MDNTEEQKDMDNNVLPFRRGNACEEANFCLDPS